MGKERPEEMLTQICDLKNAMLYTYIHPQTEQKSLRHTQKTYRRREMDHKVLQEVDIQTNRRTHKQNTHTSDSKRTFGNGKRHEDWRANLKHFTSR